MTDTFVHPDPWALAAEQLGQALAALESTCATRCAVLEEQLAAALAAAAGCADLQVRLAAADAERTESQALVARAACLEAELRQEAGTLRADIEALRQAAARQAEQQVQTAAEVRLVEVTLAARLEAAVRGAEETLARREADHRASTDALEARLALAQRSLADCEATGQRTVDTLQAELAAAHQALTKHEADHRDVVAALTAQLGQLQAACALRDADHRSTVDSLTSRLAASEQALRDNEDRWQAASDRANAAHAHTLAALHAAADEQASGQSLRLATTQAELSATQQALADLQQAHQALLVAHEQHQSETAKLRTAHAQELASAAATAAQAEATRGDCEARLAMLEAMHRALLLEASARGAAVTTISSEAAVLRRALDRAQRSRRRTLHTVRELRGLARANNAI